jgi:ArsR family transcriptional regulator
MNIVQLFKGLSDSIRLRIFYVLAVEGELCVCHLTDGLKLPQSTVSRHLNILKQSGLIASERKGKWVYYHLIVGEPFVQNQAEFIRTHAIHDEQLQTDLKNLKEISC